jgi:hypothetical protein
MFIYFYVIEIPRKARVNSTNEVTSLVKNTAKHCIKWNSFQCWKHQFFYQGMKHTSKFSEEMLYILSTSKFAGSLLVFHGGNVHYRLIPPKNFHWGYLCRSWYLGLYTLPSETQSLVITITEVQHRTGGV